MFHLAYVFKNNIFFLNMKLILIIQKEGADQSNLLARNDAKETGTRNFNKIGNDY